MSSSNCAVVSAARLAQAEKNITVDPEIMGGLPVFSGTRLPIETVANAKTAGSSDESLIATYPFLTPSMIRDAEIFQQAHPRHQSIRPLGELNPTWKLVQSKVVRLNQPVDRSRSDMSADSSAAPDED